MITIDSETEDSPTKIQYCLPPPIVRRIIQLQEDSQMYLIFGIRGTLPVGYGLALSHCFGNGH